ncbi:MULTISPECIES: SDR family oxidoreductase [Bradyrhizobium]|uniref:Nucleoside-diphosphate sugar epimerase n=1 Tax=Bradyrhizobium yuanmingense TaxID=108015 RepID=A0A0R3CYG7_9BRAD|nr:MULTISPECIES: SDR family oxidoreductase [Bradyrhizobium]KRQ02651.1 nucleoside-diphosphate sugar epimerase [Bradyrhizobium yuanmingense]MCA1364139.1 SDR family oxidoreductase [Bradyrhizobium sp. IC4059]MCA1391875.1 SDR family oxidoreductase [Bradyrhizobium sp. IC3123]MCA1429728.1 SDR family oxidoreductase [Bradyrhizobium sp. NBAIM16]MCA1478618.1 SDR family oxidoreductase [Bradyrhizobium sp. NBAIM08]
MSERTVLVLGASGLIGRFVTDDLRTRGFRVVGVARSLSPAQRMSALDIELPILILDTAALTRLLSEHAVDVVVNCLGVLQDGPGSNTSAVHRDFVARLLRAIGGSGRAIRLVHISIPGSAEADRTAFATTKREAERLIGASGIPHAILRPGFVVAPSAYGGSAMLRALAAFPIDLPAKDMATPFQPVAIEDITATIAWLAARDIDDASLRAVSWDLMQAEPITMAGVIKPFRHAFGTDGWPRIAMPRFLLDLGVKLGDVACYLGWTPPMRSTAIAELRRGVTGDPSAWSAATGIAPKHLAEAIGRHPASIQDKWFARLFLVKALIFASLVAFWVVSGFIALFVSYGAAAGILTAHNFPPALVDPITIGTSLMDMSIGVLIAFRRTAAIGLVAGIFASLGYMLGAAILTPDLWIEPLGALVKTGPAIVLMVVALLMLDNR